MSETKLVVRDEMREVSLICHGSDVHRVVAALSADPVTIAELETALQRFMAVDPGGFFRGANDCIDDEPWDSGLVVIDLAARLVVVDSTYFTTKQTGQVFNHSGDECTNIPIGYSIADDWEISDDADHWHDLAADRRRQRIGKTPLDTRAVLYGRPLLEFLAKECWGAFQQDNECLALAAIRPGDRDDKRMMHPCNDTLKEIHARWLMTPCAELESRIPREVLLADRERLSEDMQQRCDQWARTQQCPRGLDASAHAFRFGGFGTHELVKYYEMVRELLWSCWTELTERSQAGVTACRTGANELADFLDNEVPRMERVRDEWLNTPDPDCHLRTPQSIIDRERARLPEALFGKEAMIDPDCPCCQMLAELPGPTFMHLDASGMDWEFPFDIYCRTREEWHAQQREYAEFSESPNEDVTPFGIPRPINGADDSESIWKRSFSMAESTDLPMGVRLLGVAWHIAELVMELNELVDSESSTEQLNCEFRNLREILTDSSRTEARLDPALERFGQTLGDIAERYPELEPRCSDLARKIKSLREPSASVTS